MGCDARSGDCVGRAVTAVYMFCWVPFGLAAVWWERGHGVSKQGVVEYAVDSWFALGGRFLFVCATLRNARPGCYLSSSSAWVKTAMHPVPRKPISEKVLLSVAGVATIAALT